MAGRVWGRDYRHTGTKLLLFFSRWSLLGLVGGGAGHVRLEPNTVVQETGAENVVSRKCSNQGRYRNYAEARMSNFP